MSELVRHLFCSPAKKKNTTKQKTNKKKPSMKMRSGCFLLIVGVLKNKIDAECF